MEAQTQIEKSAHEPEERSASDRILHAARKAFSQNGYYGTSIRQISNLCGLKQPSIYHHFESKENLFRSALVSAHQEMMAFISERTDKGTSLSQDVEHIFLAFAEFHKAKRGALHLLGNLIYSAPDGLRDEYAESFGPEMTETVERAFRKWDPENRKEELKICINHTLTAYLIELSVREVEREEESLTQAMRCVRYMLKLSDIESAEN